MQLLSSSTFLPNRFSNGKRNNPADAEREGFHAKLDGFVWVFMHIRPIQKALIPYNDPTKGTDMDLLIVQLDLSIRHS